MWWSTSAISTAFFHGSPATLLRPDGTSGRSSCPTWRRAWRSAARPSCGRNTSATSPRALAEYMLERFGFPHLRPPQKIRVPGGGSLRFVAQKQAVPAACTLRLPRSVRRTIELLHRFVGGMERQKGRDARASFRWPGRAAIRSSSMALRRAPACWFRSARSPTMIDFVVDDRQDIQAPTDARHVHRRPSAETTVAGGVGGKAAVPAGRRLENEFKVRAEIEAAIGARHRLSSACSRRAIRWKASPRRGACHRPPASNEGSFEDVRIDLPPQPNGCKVQWSYLPKQFSAEEHRGDPRPVPQVRA